jgi:hypothetical protein
LLMRRFQHVHDGIQNGHWVSPLQGSMSVMGVMLR